MTAFDVVVTLYVVMMVMVVLSLSLSLSLCSSRPSSAEVHTPISHPGGGCARFWVREEREVGLLGEGGEKGGWWGEGVRVMKCVKCEVYKRCVS